MNRAAWWLLLIVALSVIGFTAYREIQYHCVELDCP